MVISTSLEGLKKRAPKRKSYFADDELQTAKYAARNGYRAAERKSGVSEKTCKGPAIAKVTLTEMKKTKKG